MNNGFLTTEVKGAHAHAAQAQPDWVPQAAPSFLQDGVVPEHPESWVQEPSLRAAAAATMARKFI